MGSCVRRNDTLIMLSKPPSCVEASSPLPPGLIDVQSATYDDPNAVPPQAHIQVAERIKWMERAHELPTFERFPPQS